ncbi:MAG: hypothetical protein ACE5Q6_05240 [Dehalococcoidia bacterium]
MAILLGVMLTAAWVSAPATLSAQGLVEAPFDSDYVNIDLGSVPGLPTPYGGLTFLAGDPDTILIGGNANNADGLLYSIGVVRDVDNHITGFSGSATFFADAANNDGGVVYGPGGVLFLARYPNNEIGQTKPGSAITDKIVDLTPLGVTPSPGGLNFVPAGFPGAGQLKSVSWAGGQWYTLAYAADGTGTFDITGATLETTITGGPEGLVYVPPGSPVFDDLGLDLLVSEWSAGNVVAYGIDNNGDPIPATRTVFISGLSGAEGAVIDPLTGDFLFSTFEGGDRVVVVQGFEAPPPPTGTIIIGKITDPSEGGSFGFSEDITDGGFNLNDGDLQNFVDVPVGTYHVTEDDPGPDFTLTGLTCSDPDDGSAVDLVTRSATIDLDGDETIFCNFTNTFNEPTPGTVIIKKVTNPPGGAGFGFTEDITNSSFSLDDGGNQTFLAVAPGTYAVTEDPSSSGFDLSGVNCDDTDSLGSVGTRSATILLGSGETVTCTFTNTVPVPAPEASTRVGGNATFLASESAYSTSFGMDIRLGVVGWAALSSIGIVVALLISTGLWLVKRNRPC